MRHTGFAVPKRRLIWLLSLSFWTTCGAVSGLQIWISMITHGHALWRVVLYQVLVWDAWAVLALPIAWLARRFSLVPPSPRSVLAHLLAALLIPPCTPCGGRRSSSRCARTTRWAPIASRTPSRA
jgi:hypothetical protein